MTALFRATAPKAMLALMAEFQFTRDDAAAIMGNAGHESGGLMKLQEIEPTVEGSRGGWGWFQWTGPRRRAFEAWAKANRLDAAGYAANLGYLIFELRGPEKAAVKATKAARGLQAKVETFERTFERAGVKHYPSRLKYAQMALEAYDKHIGAAPVVVKAPIDWGSATSITQNGVTLDKPPIAAPAPGFWAGLFAAIAKAFRPKAPA